MSLKPGDFYTSSQSGETITSILEEEPLRALVGGVNTRTVNGVKVLQPALLARGDGDDVPFQYWGKNVLGAIGPIAGESYNVPFGLLRAVMEAYNTNKSMDADKNEPREIDGPFAKGRDLIETLMELPTNDDDLQTKIAALKARTYNWTGNDIDDDLEDGRITLADDGEDVTLDNLLSTLFSFGNVDGNNIDDITEVLAIRTSVLEDVLGTWADADTQMADITTTPINEAVGDTASIAYVGAGTSPEAVTVDDGDGWLDTWVTELFSAGAMISLQTSSILLEEDGSWNDETGFSMNPLTDAVPTVDIPSFTLSGMQFTDLSEFEIEDATGTPENVSVADNIADAIDSYTGLANTRHAAELAKARQSLENGRAVMTTHFDNAAAMFASNLLLEIADYDARLRIEQAKLQANCDLEFERMKREVINIRMQAYQMLSGLADLELRAELAEADAKLKSQTQNGAFTVDEWRVRIEDARNAYTHLLQEADQVLRSQIEAHRAAGTLGNLNLNAVQATRANKLTELMGDRDGELRAAIAEAQTDAQLSIAADENLTRQAITSEDNSIKVAIANEEFKVNRLKLRADMSSAIYDTITSWIRNWSTNLGPAAGLISAATEINVNEIAARRQYMMNREKLRHDLASSVAASAQTAVDYRWKSILQNMMVLKEGLSSIGMTAVGTETVSANVPSNFERSSANIGLLGNIVTTGLQIAGIFS